MKRLIQFVIFSVLIAAFIYLGSKDYREKIKNKNKSETASNVLIDGDTLFVKANHSKILSKLSSSSSSFILYTCTDDNKLCPKYGMLINDVLKNYDVEDIYYYDFKQDRKNNNGTYQKIVSKLESYLITDDYGKQNLRAPSIYFIKNGEVYSYDDSLAFHRGKNDIKDLWNDKVKEEKREYLISVMEGYILHE